MRKRIQNQRDRVQVIPADLLITNRRIELMSAGNLGHYQLNHGEWEQRFQIEARQARLDGQPIHGRDFQLAVFAFVNARLARRRRPRSSLSHTRRPIHTHKSGGTRS